MKLARDQLRRWINLRTGFSPVDEGSRFGTQYFLVHGKFHPRTGDRLYPSLFYWYVTFALTLELGSFTEIQLEQYSEVLSEIPEE